ncbi:MAG: amylo-alpha-1,6-glucosidase, partial [bacterium]
MTIDISHVPFSRLGSYYCFSEATDIWPQATDERGVYLRTVIGRARAREIARVELLDGGTPVPFTIEATPALLRLEAAAGWVEICFAEPHVIYARGAGVELELTGKHKPINYTFVFGIGDGLARWIVGRSGTKFGVTATVGALALDCPWATGGPKPWAREHSKLRFSPDESGRFEAVLEAYRHSWKRRSYPLPFDDAVREVDAEFDAFVEATPSVPADLADLRKLAAYVNWSAVVGPEGSFRRPAMLMSKNWMTQVWSWDHCFNAIALSYANPQLAWDQLMVQFDAQDEYGALPDGHTDAGPSYIHCKPPIHGWTLLKMLERTDWIGPAHLEELYPKLERWTRWWLEYRDDDEDGVPQYNHGNDSGWDNSTIMIDGYGVEAPDLSAFMVIQMEALAEVARRLGREADAKDWDAGAAAMLDRMLAHFRRGDRLVPLMSGSHAEIDSQSLIRYVPLILGNRLPVSVVRSMVDDLKSGFITDWGAATEHPASPHFLRYGHWRGPIWPPSSMLIVDGLEAVGEHELALDLCRKYAGLVRKSGFCEKFDPLEGEEMADR